MRDPRPVSQVLAEEGVASAIALKHVASILYTYRCSLSCKHCCFYSSPRRPDRHTDHEEGLRWLADLHRLDRVVHIAGGEAMLYWDDLLRLCHAAHDLGVAPHFIETNATFAGSEEVAIDRFRALGQCGVQGVLISSDPYHQRLCPPERFDHALAAAVKVFGTRNVVAGAAGPEGSARNRAIAQDKDRLREYTLAHPPLLSGRAGDELSRYFIDRPPNELLDGMWHGGAGCRDCRVEFDPETMWEVHIDPHGNVQTCCLVVLGNLRTSALADVMDPGWPGRGPITRTLHDEGPIGLIALAREHGYQPRVGYPQKCGMCWELRKFLRPWYPGELGPDEVYTPDPSD